EYSFTGLTPGEYKVMFVAPEGFEFTTANVGDDALDSDADPTMDGMTQVVTLTSGEFNDTLDAGLIQPTPGIDIEKFVNGADADTEAEAVEILPGDDAVFTYEVTNTGEVAFAANEVIVTDDNGTAGDTSDDFNPEQVLANGFNTGDTNQNNALDSGETWFYTKTVAAEDLSTSTTITTNQVIDFEGFAAGTVIDNEYASLGVTISATGGSNQAMIFDSANPTGGDHDLETPGYGNNNTTAQGNILIISEDGDSSDPDDNAGGGTITFTFDNAVNVNSLSFVDIEESGGKVFTTDADGNVTTTNIAAPGDNSFQTLTINDDDVVKLEVDLVGSGSISSVDFDSIETSTAPGIYTNIGEVVAGNVNDEDAANYVNPTPEPGIDIEKFVNGIDANSPDEYPELTPGDDVTFTYDVTNTGNVAFAAADVIVTDDNGTPDDTSDDFNPDQVLVNGFNVGDVNQNNQLDATEIWKYSETLTVEDLSSSETIRIEAEDLHLYNYGVEHGDFASGGELIALHGHEGTASTTFSGETGQYDVIVGYYDENDGHATGKFKLNGQIIDSWTFEEDLGSNLPNEDTFVTRTVAEHITIEYGDSLTLKGIEDDYEFARFDYIELVKKGDEDGIYENVATVEAGDVSDSDMSGYVNPEGEPEPQPSQNSLLFSLKDHQNLDGINFEPEDIVEYNLADQSFSKFFDGSDVGLEGFKIDAFEVISDNEILLSFKYAQDIGGIHVDDSDIVKLTA
ncbi:MAG: SdrD B-like domain-containing protein, partial [Crocosphaera sp.]